MLVFDDHAWLKYAFKLAVKAQTLGEVPVGAVLVLNNEIIGEGWNQSISSCDPTAHAEILALRAGAGKLGNYRLPNTTLYVTLEPCVMCVGALIQARVKRIVFGAYDARVGALESMFNITQIKELNHKIDFIGGVLQQECSDLLKIFFKSRR